jgi:type I restriction enzyme R subunit
MAGAINWVLTLQQNDALRCAKQSAIEALKQLINGEVRSQAKRNTIRSRAFSERLEAAIIRYHANAITTPQALR